MRVASKVGNLRSEFGHARFLGSLIIRYVRDRRTDGRTKADLTAPGWGIIMRRHASTDATVAAMIQLDHGCGHDARKKFS